MGAASRLTTLLVGLICGAALFFGASLLSFFPKAVIAWSAVCGFLSSTSAAKASVAEPAGGPICPRT